METQNGITTSKLYQEKVKKKFSDHVGKFSNLT
jgi:hypothetical protein